MSNQVSKVDQMLAWLDDGDQDSDPTWVPAPPSKAVASSPAPSTAAATAGGSGSNSNVASPNQHNRTGSSSPEASVSSQKKSDAPTSGSPNRSSSPTGGSSQQPTTGGSKFNVVNTSVSSFSPKGRERAQSTTSSRSPGIGGLEIPSKFNTILSPPMAGPQRPRSFSAASSQGAPAAPNNSFTSYDGGSFGSQPNNSFQGQRSSNSFGAMSLGRSAAGVSQSGGFSMNEPPAGQFQQRQRGLSTSSVGGPQCPNNSMAGAPEGLGLYADPNAAPPPSEASNLSALQLQEQQANQSFRMRQRGLSSASQGGGPQCPNNSMASMPGGLYDDPNTSPPPFVAGMQMKQRERSVSTASVGSMGGGPGVPNNSMASLPGGLLAGAGLDCDFPQSTDQMGEEMMVVDSKSAESVESSALTAEERSTTTMVPNNSMASVPNSSLASLPGSVAGMGPPARQQAARERSYSTGTSTIRPYAPPPNNSFMSNASSVAPPGVPNNSITSSSSSPGAPGMCAFALEDTQLDYNPNMAPDTPSSGFLQAPNNSAASLASFGMLTPSEGGMSPLAPGAMSPLQLQQLRPSTSLASSKAPVAPNTSFASNASSLLRTPEPINAVTLAQLAEGRSHYATMQHQLLELSEENERRKIQVEYFEIEMMPLVQRNLLEAQHSWSCAHQSAAGALLSHDSSQTIKNLGGEPQPTTAAQQSMVERLQIEENNKKLIRNDLIGELYHSNLESAAQLKEVSLHMIQMSQQQQQQQQSQQEQQPQQARAKKPQPKRR